MFKSISDTQNFILEENILYLEIRSIDNKKINSVVFISDYIISDLENFLSKDFNDGNIFIKNIDLSSSFMEVFLAHKTLVFFAESLDLLNNTSNLNNKYSFKIKDNINIPSLASPDIDKYRDFIGEISSGLLDIREKVSYFYQDKNDLHSLVLKESSKYSREKLKYVILMVAKAYNISIDNNTGVFI